MRRDVSDIDREFMERHARIDREYGRLIREYDKVIKEADSVKATADAMIILPVGIVFCAAVVFCVSFLVSYVFGL